MWGNPFKINTAGWLMVHIPHRRKVLDPWIIYQEEPTMTAVEAYEMLLRSDFGAFGLSLTRRGFRILRHLDKLEGKNLACWCPLDQPCHADVLLELANREK